MFYSGTYSSLTRVVDGERSDGYGGFLPPPPPPSSFAPSITTSLSPHSLSLSLSLSLPHTRTIRPLFPALQTVPSQLRQPSPLHPHPKQDGRSATRRNHSLSQFA